MTDENGKRYGYGYEMMQNISNYMQCTFSYVGYDKTAAECVDMLIDNIDRAIDQMNIEVPNWCSDLYAKYYGAQDLNAELTAKEIELLKKLRSENAVVKVVLSPDTAPY